MGVRKIGIAVKTAFLRRSALAVWWRDMLFIFQKHTPSPSQEGTFLAVVGVVTNNPFDLNIRNFPNIIKHINVLRH